MRSDHLTKHMRTHVKESPTKGGASHDNSMQEDDEGDDGMGSMEGSTGEIGGHMKGKEMSNMYGVFRLNGGPYEGWGMGAWDGEHGKLNM